MLVGSAESRIESSLRKDRSTRNDLFQMPIVFPVIGWLSSHGLELVTAISLLMNIYLGYYRVKYYRGQSANLSIVGVESAYAKPVDQLGEPIGYQYNVGVDVQNDGRDLATVSGATLEFDNGEELELYNIEASKWSNFDIETQETVSPLRGVKYSDEKQESATLKLKTTEGELTTRIDF